MVYGHRQRTNFYQLRRSNTKNNTNTKKKRKSTDNKCTSKVISKDGISHLRMHLRTSLVVCLVPCQLFIYLANIEYKHNSCDLAVATNDAAALSAKRAVSLRASSLFSFCSLTTLPLAEQGEAYARGCAGMLAHATPRLMLDSVLPSVRRYPRGNSCTE